MWTEAFNSQFRIERGIAQPAEALDCQPYQVDIVGRDDRMDLAATTPWLEELEGDCSAVTE